MTTKRCDECDKLDCTKAAANEAFHTYPSERAVKGNPEWDAIVERKYKAEYVCASNRVNWRERALVAESKMSSAIMEGRRIISESDGKNFHREGAKGAAQILLAVLGVAK